MKYAILGAGGTVGKALARELSAAGERFRVVGRSADKLRRDFAAHGDAAEVVAADLSDAAAAADAVRVPRPSSTSWESPTRSSRCTRS